MNPQILKLNIDKWLKACQYLKSEYENLNVDEQSAIDILCDFWRRDYSTSLVEECESQMQVLKDGHKYHGNNISAVLPAALWSMNSIVSHIESARRHEEPATMTPRT